MVTNTCDFMNLQKVLPLHSEILSWKVMRLEICIANKHSEKKIAREPEKLSTFHYK